MTGYIQPPVPPAADSVDIFLLLRKRPDLAGLPLLTVLECATATATLLRDLGLVAGRGRR